MTAPDHYTTLGILPKAEAIVISAAYRALAQRYHPDKFPDDPEKAHRRMSEINEAYRVLGNEKLRAQYDATRVMGDHADYRSAESEESKQAFGAALHELEDRWAVAVDIFPDLTTLRGSLSKISTSLAFGFVTILLDTKSFNQRAEIASRLERHFLERYFGTNERIVGYAKELIQADHREAARTLNNLVDVMGSEVDPNLLLQRVEKQYSIKARRLQKEGLEKLASRVREGGYFADAFQLANLLGYKVQEQSSGFLGSNVELTVTSPQGTPTRFNSIRGFVDWVKESLCQ
jgi:hypothetical protein